MKSIIALLFVLVANTTFAQNKPSPKQDLLRALPALDKYQKYTLVYRSQEDKAAMAYYRYGSYDTEQLITVLLSDKKIDKNNIILSDIEMKYEVAASSKDKTVNRPSKIKLGTKGLVAHDSKVGIKRIYLFYCLLKNRYTLEFNLTNTDIKSLDDFEAFINTYMTMVNVAQLEN